MGGLTLGGSRRLGGAHGVGLCFGYRLIRASFRATLKIPRPFRLGNSLVHGPCRLGPRYIERMAEVGGLRSPSLVVSQRTGRHH